MHGDRLLRKRRLRLLYGPCGGHDASIADGPRVALRGGDRARWSCCDVFSECLGPRRRRTLPFLFPDIRFPVHNWKHGRELHRHGRSRKHRFRRLHDYRPRHHTAARHGARRHGPRGNGGVGGIRVLRFIRFRSRGRTPRADLLARIRIHVRPWRDHRDVFRDRRPQQHRFRRVQGPSRRHDTPIAHDSRGHRRGGNRTRRRRGSVFRWSDRHCRRTRRSNLQPVVRIHVPARPDTGRLQRHRRPWECRDRHLRGNGPRHHGPGRDDPREHDRRGDRSGRGPGHVRGVRDGHRGRTVVGILLPSIWFDVPARCDLGDVFGHGRSGEPRIVVTVVDTTPPIVTVPPSISVEATGPTGAVVTFSSSASDIVDGFVTVSCSPTSGSIFPLGTKVVTCTATDLAGNTGAATFEVSVVDTTPPALSLPTDITQEATGPSGAVVSFTVSANDLVDGTVPVHCIPLSGSTFSIGTTSVSCSTTDAAGNVASGSFDVIVRDTTPPALTLPADMIAEATGPSGASVFFAPSATDLVDGSVAVSCSPASEWTFPLGTTVVLCTATDAHGNPAAGSFDVTVQDTTPPTLVLPGTITAEATGPSGAAVGFSASASDLVSGPVAAQCTPASSSMFPLGTTTVMCTATDSHGNTASGSFDVIVVDTTPPTMTSPPGITLEATGASGATGIFVVTADDLVDGRLTPVCTPASGSTFGFGATTVVCRATDAHGNTGIASFTIHVVDTTPPSLTVPADITAEATGPGGATVPFSVGATDIVDGPVTATCSPSSEFMFPLGTTRVDCTATDFHANAVTATFTITIRDTTPPIVTVPFPFSVEATGPTGAVVTFSSSASDIVDGSMAVSCAPTSGSTFSLGSTAVTCTATDSAGNTGASTFEVSVVDTTPPALSLPADITREATGSFGAIVSFAASADDLVDGAIPVHCTPLPGSTFAIGTTSVSCSATDVAGNTASGSFDVIVQDTTPPALTIPADAIAEATGPSGAVVSFVPSATDIVDGPVPVSCSPASGSMLPLGTTVVLCTATDAHGNSATGSFEVAVRDTTPPTLVLPRTITAEATGPSRATAAVSASASELLDRSGP